MRLKGRRILITGGGGFIGGHVAHELIRRECEIVSFSRSLPSQEIQFLLRGDRGSFRIEFGSIEDLPRLIEVVKSWEPTAIVHLASNVDVAALFHNPILAFRVDLAGTLNVFEAARLFGVSRVVNFSSIGVLPPIQYEPIDAAHPIVLPRFGPGAGGYGAAKASGELFSFAYEQAFGLDVRTIRPSAVYGFGMPWHSPNYMEQFVEPAIDGKEVKLASGGLLPRDYTHVTDVATLAAAVLEAPNDADRVFFAATGQPLVTASEVARLVAQLIPGSSIEIGDRLTAEDEIEASFRGVISIESARTQLGWTPRYSSLDAGVSEYIAAYRAYVRGRT